MITVVWLMMMMMINDKCKQCGVINYDAYKKITIDSMLELKGSDKIPGWWFQKQEE